MTMNNDQATVTQYYSPLEVTAILSCGRSKVYELMESGDLKSVKMGGLRRIPQPALVEYQQQLERDAARECPECERMVEGPRCPHCDPKF